MKTYTWSSAPVNLQNLPRPLTPRGYLFNGAPWAGAIVLTIWHAIALAMAFS